MYCPILILNCGEYATVPEKYQLPNMGAKGTTVAKGCQAKVSTLIELRTQLDMHAIRQSTNLMYTGQAACKLGPYKRQLLRAKGTV
jgi:hypothetical protein